MTLNKILILSCSILALTACSQKAKETLGVGRQAPDEFAVVERAPLSIPPTYRLNTPQPGAVRPQEISPTDKARQLLTGQKSTISSNASSGETALLQEAGGLDADADIRATLNAEYGVIPEGAEKERTVDKLNPFKAPATKGKLIDPTEEAETLIEDGVKAPQPVIRDTDDNKK